MKTRFLTLTMLLTAMGLAFVACKKEDPKPKGEPVGKVISATLASPDAMRSPDGRTHLDVTTGGLTPTLWSYDDGVALFSSNGEDSDNPGYLKPYYYGITAGVDTQDASFEAYEEPEPGDAYCVFYPANYIEYMNEEEIAYSTTFINCAYDNGEFTLNYHMGQFQMYQPIDAAHPNATFAEWTNPAMGYGYGTNYRFWNLMGLLRVELYSEVPCNVGLITLTDSNENNILWGTGTVSMSDAPTSTDAADAMLTSTFVNEEGGTFFMPLGIDCLDNGDPNTIALFCVDYDSEGVPVSVPVSTDPNNPSKFYFLVPDYALDDGFEISFYDLDLMSFTTRLHSTISKHYTGDIIKRNIITVLPTSQIGSVGSPVSTYSGCSSGTAYAMTASVYGYDADHTSYTVGLCYSTTNPNPTTADAYTVIQSSATINFGETVDFTYDLTGLATGETYYVRAYVNNGTGINYGDVKRIIFGDSPQPLPSTWTNGENPHPFTIGTPKKGINTDLVVHFSQGNLQYNATGSSATASPGDFTDENPANWVWEGNVGGTWQFAEHQFDYIGADNENIAQTYTGWIDLFGWGTSGYNHNDKCYQPWSTNTVPSQYSPYYDTDQVLLNWPLDSPDFPKVNGMADWGYNAISNGGNTEHQWRILAEGEWQYLLARQDGNLCGLGKVGCVNGLILLPDDWGEVETPAFNPMALGFNGNQYSYSEWSQMEAQGAVFLPAAGGRLETTVENVGDAGFYWIDDRTALKNGKDVNAYVSPAFLSIHPTTWMNNPCQWSYGHYGYSVRLVKVVQTGK